MKEVSERANSLTPDVIEVTISALHAAVDSLPGRPSSRHVNLLAGFILRTAMAGERDVTVLQTSALWELEATAPT